MTEILLPTKAMQDAIKASTDLIGTANPAVGGTGNLFAYLKQINDYVDTIEAKLGLNTDASGTTSVFARLAQIAAYVDTMEGLIGTANPTTGGTDTLFKYLKKLDAYFPVSGGTDWSKYLPCSVTNNSQSLSSTNGETTILNVNGKGFLNWAHFNVGAFTTSNSYYLKVYIDGVKKIDMSVWDTGGSRNLYLSARKFLLQGTSLMFPNCYGYFQTTSTIGELGNLPTTYVMDANASGGSANPGLLFEEPIPFTSNLKVTVQVVNPGAVTSVHGIGYLLG